MRALAEAAVNARLTRLNWVEGLGEPLIAGHVPAEVLGEQTSAEQAWFALARQVTLPTNDGVVLPPFKFKGCVK